MTDTVLSASFFLFLLFLDVFIGSSSTIPDRLIGRKSGFCASTMVTFIVKEEKLSGPAGMNCGMNSLTSDSARKGLTDVWLEDTATAQPLHVRKKSSRHGFNVVRMRMPKPTRNVLPLERLSHSSEDGTRKQPLQAGFQCASCVNSPRRPGLEGLI
mmetsp:Transcript_25327/g.46710  ORF Transcript_25327/g.46710 Transcript_25327/m.46710 type:complete len:156 (+) Transcript_25327:804-1271(+)